MQFHSPASPDSSSQLGSDSLNSFSEVFSPSSSTLADPLAVGKCLMSASDPGESAGLGSTEEMVVLSGSIFVVELLLFTSP